MLRYFHVLIHFTLMPTPGGWGISHMLRMKKNDLREVKHLIHGQEPFT